MIAISGKERSGTTWLELLLKENYFTCGIDAKDKHNFTGKKRSTDIETVVISKHPLEWWLSWYNYAGRRKISFDEFSLDYFDTWNNFYYCWILWKEKAPIKFIRYIDLYESPQLTLTVLNVKRNDFMFDRVRHVVCADGSQTDEIFKRQILTYDNYPMVREKIEEKIDYHILHYLGYEMEG